MICADVKTKTHIAAGHHEKTWVCQQCRKSEKMEGRVSAVATMLMMKMRLMTPNAALSGWPGKDETET